MKLNRELIFYLFIFCSVVQTIVREWGTLILFFSNLPGYHPKLLKTCHWAYYLYSDKTSLVGHHLLGNFIVLLKCIATWKRYSLIAFERCWILICNSINKIRYLSLNRSRILNFYPLIVRVISYNFYVESIIIKNFGILFRKYTFKVFN